jgi:hypothetical protein
MTRSGLETMNSGAPIAGSLKRSSSSGGSMILWTPRASPAHVTKTERRAGR